MSSNLDLLESVLGFQLVKSAHSGVHAYYQCAGSYVCTEKCGFSCTKLKFESQRQSHIVANGSRYWLKHMTCSVRITVMKQYTSDSIPFYSVSILEHHIHQVITNQKDELKDSELLNFLNSPSENLILAPPQIQSLFALDPKLVNLDRVKYQTMRAFINRFHFKPNHFSSLKSICSEFSLRFKLFTTENNMILLALSHPAFLSGEQSISSTSILSADVAHKVCVSNIGTFHLWWIMTYCHSVGRTLQTLQFLPPDLTTCNSLPYLEILFPLSRRFKDHRWCTLSV